MIKKIITQPSMYKQNSQKTNFDLDNFRMVGMETVLVMTPVIEKLIESF